VRVFKHDFWAATCLYESPGADPPRAVVKFARAQDFCGLPLAWVGRMTSQHERLIYRALSGVGGVPRWLGALGESAYAIEYLDARPLDHHERPPAGFFDGARRILDAVHARGVAYCDANKRSNFLVGEDGRAHLIDFQIALRRRDDLPWPLRAISRAFVAYMQQRDVYHLYKHKRRMCPDQLTEEEDALSRRRGRLHRLHRAITKPYRTLRRRFLRKRHQAGKLVSPTAALEDHHQPEKATWRQDGP